MLSQRTREQHLATEKRLSKSAILLLGKLALGGIGGCATVESERVHFHLSSVHHSVDVPATPEEQMRDLEQRLGPVGMRDLRWRWNFPNRTDIGADSPLTVHGLEHIAVTDPRGATPEGFQAWIRRGLPAFLRDARTIERIEMRPQRDVDQGGFSQMRQNFESGGYVASDEGHQGRRIVCGLPSFEHRRATGRCLTHELTHVFLSSLPPGQGAVLWDRIVRYLGSEHPVNFHEERYDVIPDQPGALFFRADEWLGESLEAYLRVQEWVLDGLDAQDRLRVELVARASLNRPEHEPISQEELIDFAWLTMSSSYQDRGRQPISFDGFREGLQIIKDIMALDPNFDWRTAAQARLAGFSQPPLSTAERPSAQAMAASPTEHSIPTSESTPTHHTREIDDRISFDQDVAYAFSSVRTEDYRHAFYGLRFVTGYYLEQYMGEGSIRALRGPSPVLEEDERRKSLDELFAHARSRVFFIHYRNNAYQLTEGHGSDAHHEEQRLREVSVYSSRHHVISRDAERIPSSVLTHQGQGSTPEAALTDALTHMLDAANQQIATGDQVINTDVQLVSREHEPRARLVSERFRGMYYLDHVSSSVERVQDSDGQLTYQATFRAGVRRLNLAWFL